MHRVQKFVEVSTGRIHEATQSGVRLDSKILGVSVEPDVVKNRIVEFVSKLALK